MKVKLNDIIMGLESTDEETRVYYSRKKNELVYFGDYIENDDEEEELLDEDDLIALPDRYEINEYRMMEDFIETVDDVKDHNCLIISIQGSGAFRRFKDMAINLGLIDKWYEFRDKAYRYIAIDWCSRKHLEFEEQ